jgi:hypothetical protein
MFSGELSITMAAELGRRTYSTAASSVLAAATLSFALAAPRLRSIDIPAALAIGAT